MYQAWEGIVRLSGKRADVNLWLNRRSPWLDVWSWLPYEGKLTVSPHTSHRIVGSYLKVEDDEMGVVGRQGGFSKKDRVFGCSGSIIDFY